MATHTHSLLPLPFFEGGAGNGATSEGETMMMFTIFCVTVGVLIPLVVSSNNVNPPPLPHTGKLSIATLTNCYIIQESNYMEDTII